jgi:FeS assembly SUF system protein
MADNMAKKKHWDSEVDSGRLAPEDVGKLRSGIVAALKTVYDPEIPVDIYEMGLIYRLDISDNGAIFIQMTLTSPACPVAGSLPGDVETAVGAVDGVKNVSVELVWDPPWDMEKMSEAAKLELGFL